MTAKELEAMVTEINATQVEPWDRLTDQVYHYDPIDRVFEKAATFEARIEKKAEAEKAAKNSPSWISWEKRKKQLKQWSVKRRHRFVLRKYLCRRFIWKRRKCWND